MLGTGLPCTGVKVKCSQAREEKVKGLGEGKRDCKVRKGRDAATTAFLLAAGSGQGSREVTWDESGKAGGADTTGLSWPWENISAFYFNCNRKTMKALPQDAQFALSLVL